MTAQVLTYHMPAGVPGNVTRSQTSRIEPNNFDKNYPCLAYGIPVKIVSGLIRTLPSGAVAGDIYGMLVRPFPINSSFGAPAALGAGTPNVGGPCDILAAGYMTVTLARGTAVRGAAVGVRTTAGSHTLLDIEDTANVGAGDSDCVLLGATFMGPADANGLVEIYFKTR